ncbi:MAG TPA: FtsX-like permease family protein, partial [Ktedonobacterales bacterium]
AAFATGADIRLQTTPTVGEQEASDYSAHLRTLSGVQAVSGVYRTNASMLVDRGLQGVDMLGVDPSTFAAVTESTSWRTDYAAQSLPALMAQLRAHQSNLEAGSQAHPMWAIVSETLARQSRLKVGDRFQAIISDISYTSTSFVVGAIITQFPTLYPGSAPGGFMILDAHDLDGAITAHALANNSVFGSAAGVNEFWLRTAGDLASDQMLIQTMKSQQANFSLTSVQSLREAVAQAEANPVNGGMRGLLLLGALAAALLAILGTLAQAIVAARQRSRQFAVLRTLGMATRQLGATLLSEQLVVYLFGLLGGTLLGLILLSATVPYLQFSDALVDPSTVGVPGYLLRINGLTTAAFYGALLLAFLLALLITARFAARIGLAKTLRIGED